MKLGGILDKNTDLKGAGILMNPNPIISSGHLYFPGAWTAVFSLDWSASGRDAPHQTLASWPSWHVQKFKSRRNEVLCGSDRYEGAPGQSWERKAARRWGRAGWAGTARLRARPPTPCKPCTLALLSSLALHSVVNPLLTQMFCLCILHMSLVVVVFCRPPTLCIIELFFVFVFCICLLSSLSFVVHPLFARLNCFLSLYLYFAFVSCRPPWTVHVLFGLL